MVVRSLHGVLDPGDGAGHQDPEGRRVVAGRQVEDDQGGVDHAPQVAEDQPAHLLGHVLPDLGEGGPVGPQGPGRLERLDPGNYTTRGDINCR